MLRAKPVTARAMLRRGNLEIEGGPPFRVAPSERFTGRARRRLVGLGRDGLRVALRARRDARDTRIRVAFQPVNQLVVPKGYPVPRRIKTATTKPRMIMVSGMAIRMMAVVESSGFSDRAAAAAGPMRPCAHAVARAGSPSPARLRMKLRSPWDLPSQLPCCRGCQWVRGR